MLSFWNRNNIPIYYNTYNNNEVIRYNYINKTNKLDGLIIVYYHPGKWIKQLKNINETYKPSHYFQKENGKWVYYGKIIYAYVPDEGVSTLLILPQRRILTSGKEKSLNIINYKKDTGKETGNFQQGFCKLVEK